MVAGLFARIRGCGNSKDYKIALLLPGDSFTRFQAADRSTFESAVADLCTECEVLYSNANGKYSRQTRSRFLELFPDNDACLEHLKERLFADGTECPKCEKASKFHRIKGVSAYSCQFCGHHVYPTAGTIFHKSTVSLQLWFFAIYLMSSTHRGISAKQLEREIGVTHTAHRVFKQIRTLLAVDDGQLDGDVEVDESAYSEKPTGQRNYLDEYAFR